MEIVKLYERVINDGTLRVAAGTTGPDGSEMGHVCRTFIELEDIAGKDVTFNVSKDGKLLEIETGGGSELNSIIEACEFVLNALKRKEDSSASYVAAV